MYWIGMAMSLATLIPLKVIEQVNTIEEAKSDSSLQPLAQLHEKMLAGEKGFGTYTYEGEAKLFRLCSYFW